MTEKKSSWLDCEYRRDEYCANPQRHDKWGTIALFYCQRSDCKLDTLKKWW